MLSKKDTVLQHNERTLEYVDALDKLTNEEWNSPMSEGKWSVGEVIAHFKPWDELVMEKRVPYFFSDEPFPDKGFETDERNKEAAKFARENRQEEVIERFKDHRKRFIDTLNQLDEDDFDKEIQIRDEKITIYDYFEFMIRHDDHHFKQIDAFLAKN
ncbi:DinB family protein [Halalkalibacillus sediminis]|nr:DinB family protein [Halalkalibacillus sediminis]